ncbi:hypothetical protein BC829DRAFT_389963 [Chytridium lagenaria]|nr:hypothetical protein BC829DRAFT_389963 [Chytridium lagenaria]
MLTSSRSKKASPSSATGAPPTLATMRVHDCSIAHCHSPSTPAQTTHIHTVPILPPTPKRISSTSSSSPSPVVTDPARPSRMSVTIASVNITPISGVLTPRITVKIKFRTKETHQMEVTMDPNAAVKEPVEFLLTYHGHHFDKLKVDAFEGIAGWRRKVFIVVVVEWLSRDMEDWHNGSYRRWGFIY